MSTTKRCWTCKERKVRCDQRHPECSRCVKSGRKCEGYGVRLVWPKSQHSTQMVATAGALTVRRHGPIQLVNGTVWDIETHLQLSATAGVGVYPGPRHDQLWRNSLAPSLPWKASHVKATETGLIEYFVSKASHSLATYHYDPQTLAKLLLRLALSDNSLAAIAVLRSLLAVASAHRYGLSRETTRLKLSALAAMGESSKSNLEPTDGFRHIAAGMLLCSLELDETSEQWPSYICGAKNLILTLELQHSYIERELFMILEWVYYHDVVTSFSLQHWRHGSSRQNVQISDLRAESRMPKICKVFKLLKRWNSQHESLLLLLDVIDVIKDPTDHQYHSSEYAASLKQLESRIAASSFLLDVGDDSDALKITDELYRLASLVYLQRASTNFSGSSDKLESTIERAFQILKLNRAFPSPFVLFIFGCEASTDGQRIQVLDLFQQAYQMRENTEGARRMVQAVWLQDDLGNVNYLMKLRAVFSSSSVLPSLA